MIKDEYLIKLCTVTWSDNILQNTVEFAVCVVPSSSIALSKVYTRRTCDKIVILQPFLDVLPSSANIMTSKGINLFDECVSRCAHISAKYLYLHRLKCPKAVPKKTKFRPKNK